MRCIIFIALFQLADLASAKALIAFDADFNKFNSSNETPYDIAVQKCPDIADILTGIGGMDGYQIMANLQLCGSLTEGFERLLDSAVMCMDEAVDSSTVEGSKVAVGMEGSKVAVDMEGSKVEERFESVVEENQMPSIPEGTYICNTSNATG